MIENIINDEHTLLMYKPEITIMIVEKRYENPKEVPYKIHKFHESFTL